VLVLAGAPLLALVPVVPLLAAGWLLPHSYRSSMARVSVGLERLLDELERHPRLPAGEPRPSRQAGLARGVGQVVRGITQEVRKALDE
jgi:hypothetical protein